jgi:hypothetical protein
MTSFNSTYKHLRLFADKQPEGWISAIYDLTLHKFIDKGGWIYNTAEEAKVDAEQKAGPILNEELGDISWSSSPESTPEERFLS